MQQPILPDEFSRPIWDAVEALTDVVNRAKGFLYLVSDVHAQLCYDLELAPVERAKADSLEFLAGDLAQLLESKAEAVSDELQRLRSVPANGRAARLAVAAD